jgi:hypothetical protein
MPNTNYTLTYPILIESLQTYMLRTDAPFVDQIPYLIQQGVIRVYNNAKDLGFEIRVNIESDVIGSSTVLKPSNWRETVSILMFDNRTQTTSYLLPRSREFCLTYWNNQQGMNGRPKYYSDSVLNLNNQDLRNTYGEFYWTVIPNLDQAYTFDIIYLGIPLFNADNPVNFLTQRYPNLLLYSCLIEACLFLDDEEKRNKYQSMFDQELETINRMNTDRSADRTVIRANN